MSPAVENKMKSIFPPEHWPEVATILEAECGSNLPLISSQGAEGIERVRASVLKLSEGSMDKLRYAVKVAKEDWRDVFVAAGFGDDPLAHRAWLGENSAT